MAAATLYMHKSDGKLEWYPHQRVIYSAIVGKMHDGDTAEITIKKQRPKKTRNQLGYWYGVLIPFAVDALRDSGHDTLFEISVGDLKTGVATDKDSTDLLMKTLFKVHLGSDRLLLKRDMDTETMSRLIDFTLRWLAENLGAIAPVPREM